MKDYIKIIRPNNLLFIVIILGLMEKYVAAPLMPLSHPEEPLSWFCLLLLIAATVLIAAGGYVINDYFDVKIDTINKPDELIVTRAISKDQAMRYFYILTGIGAACGIALGFIGKSIMLGALFVIVPGLLWFYSASYKRQFIVGNLIISLLSGITPLVVAFACAAMLKQDPSLDETTALYLSSQIYLWTGGFALFAFLTTLAREIVKDIEDQDGDRELECHTIAVKYGNNVAKVCATIVILGVIGALAWFTFSVLPGQFSWANWSSRFFVCMTIGMICELALLWKAQVKQDFRNAQLLLKLLMFLGTMFAFCIPSIIDQYIHAVL